MNPFKIMLNDGRGACRECLNSMDLKTLARFFSCATASVPSRLRRGFKYITKDEKIDIVMNYVEKQLCHGDAFRDAPTAIKD